MTATVRRQLLRFARRNWQHCIITGCEMDFSEVAFLLGYGDSNPILSIELS